MPDVPRYHEVNADVLVDQGLLELIREPVDGINRHPYIPWGRMSGLGVQAMYIDDLERPAPSGHHSVIVHFKRERPRPVPFVLKQGQSEDFWVSTVAGTEAGLVLIKNQGLSATAARLIMESLQVRIS